MLPRIAHLDHGTRPCRGEGTCGRDARQRKRNTGIHRRSCPYDPRDGTHLPTGIDPVITRSTVKTRTKSVVRMLFFYFVGFGLWIVTLFVLKIDKLWALFAGIGLLIVGLAILAAAILEAQRIRAAQPPR
jgi:hypothetical protein